MAAQHPPTARPRTAIVATSLALNGAGRVQVLADLARRLGEVEILAHRSPRHQVPIWPPLADDPTPRRTFDAAVMLDFIPAAQRFAESVACDRVIVSKARLTGMLVGMLIVHRLGCPILLDLDDWELGFAPGGEPLALRDVETEPRAKYDELPAGPLWSRVAETLVPSFFHRASASVSLQSRYGGMMIRHARNQVRFRPDPAVRAQVRRRFGLRPDDIAVLFLGTPRRHKGLMEVAEAIARIGDPKLRFVVIGDCSDPELVRALEAMPHVGLHPNQPWRMLPQIVQLADGVCLFQHRDSAVADYQIPAKLTDALAMGIAVAASPTAGLADIPEHVLTRLPDEGALEAWLRRLAPHGADEAGQRRRRAFFLQELSVAVNVQRLQLVFQEAEQEPARWPAEWTELFALLNRRYGTSLPACPPAWAANAAA